MKKKLWISLMMAGVLCFGTACGASSTDTASDESAETASDESTATTAGESAETASDETTEELIGDNAQIANPWSPTTEEEAKEMIPGLFHLPDGATNVYWSVMNAGDTDDSEESGPLVQATFDYDDLTFIERAQVTSDGLVDISGMYYDWTVSDDVYVGNWGNGNIEGKSYRYIGDGESIYIDLILWYDKETGTSFSLSTDAPDLDGFDIQAVAEATYD